MKQVPFNIDLLLPTSYTVSTLRPITVLDTMEGKTRNFHPNGLFSTSIFGKVGEEKRSRSFSYIDLRIAIFHPILFKAVSDLKQLYADILSGKGYAVWDEEQRDLIKSNPIDGMTGYSFFMEHYPNIVFEKRGGYRREANIALINKYRTNSFSQYLLVLPAGLRDYEYDDNGKPSQDEVNILYRSALSISNIITTDIVTSDITALNGPRYRLQLVINEIYEHYKGLLSGKKKLILAKWASRKIANGTRNVITSMVDNVQKLNDPAAIGFNQTVIGLYQFLKASLPISIYHIRNKYLPFVFSNSSPTAILVNKKTLKKEIVPINAKAFDAWMTVEGLEQTITQFEMEEIRSTPLAIGNHYFGLIYKGPDGTFRIFQDIDDLPKERSKTDVSPLTFSQLLYLSVYKAAEKLPIFATRYPVINYGSCYPSMVYLKTTVVAERREELDDQWQRTGDIVYQFPIDNEQYFDSMSIHPSHLARAGADHDGDMMAANIVYTEESIKEVCKLLQSRKYYIGPNGKFYFSGSNDVVQTTLDYITSA